MAKRSPILGYNHNVRYRGIVFHVQTEDSGVLSPHLFTHLFHGGVIVSTRKLVYDADAAEDVIKTLMQAQHKAVLKDLKRGQFDDKIDQYLGGTPGLLPRGSGGGDDDAPVRDSAPVVAPAPVVINPRTDTVQDEPSARGSAPAIKAPVAAASAPIAMPRTQTAERKSAPTQVRTNLPAPPPPADIDPPTVTDDAAASVAAAVAAANAGHANTIKIPMSRDTIDSSPEIEIRLELEDDDAVPRRSARDTDIAELGLDEDRTRPMDVGMSISDGVPGAVAGQTSRGRMPGESAPPPSAPSPERRTHPNAVGAAALPPRVITRPPSRPAITPPQVVSRPIADDAQRRDDAIEVYAPPPGSADLPPGERPGQYSQHKKVSQRIPVDTIKGERSGSVPVPPGLGRPGRPSGSPATTTAPGTGPVPRANAASVPPSSVPQARAPEPSPAGIPAAGARPRTPTPAQISASAPAQSRTGSGPAGSGVVMTRPAVIVGAPSKPAPPARVRKAREDEGRGFGQGLISEKSLDEVILAYLSEDADDK